MMNQLPEMTLICLFALLAIDSEPAFARGGGRGGHHGSGHAAHATGHASGTHSTRPYYYSPLAATNTTQHYCAATGHYVVDMRECPAAGVPAPVENPVETIRYNGR